MKNRMFFCLWLAMSLAPPVGAQTTPGLIYVESYRTGKARISEQTVIANLDVRNPSYKATIHDRDGSNRYNVEITPQKAVETDPGILAWRVQLTELRRRYMGNVLVATQPPKVLTDNATDRAWILDPSPYAGVPILAKRIFKVEGFYCVIQVKQYHKMTPERLPLDSMRVEIQFTDTDPRNN